MAVVDFCNSSYPDCAQSIADFNILANKYHGKADFGYYDCNSGKICGRYRVRTHPEYTIFKNGHQVIMYDKLTAEGLEAAIE